jgi:hypothetical protein
VLLVQGQLLQVAPQVVNLLLQLLLAMELSSRERLQLRWGLQQETKCKGRGGRVSALGPATGPGPGIAATAARSASLTAKGSRVDQCLMRQHPPHLQLLGLLPSQRGQQAGVGVAAA